MKRIHLWDLPLRLFHWALLALVVASFVSGKIGGNAMTWHGYFGAAIAGLLAFRVVWGVWGSTYARFSTFVRGPATILAYLHGRWQGIGHNPLGALSVLGMLGVLGLQVCSGLFADDDIAFRGPYVVLVSSDTSIFLTWLHKNNSWLVVLLVVLHLSAIAFYTRVKGDNLVKPMIDGYREVDGELEKVVAENRTAKPAALVLALLFAIAGIWVASGGLANYFAPPAPPAAATPAW